MMQSFQRARAIRQARRDARTLGKGVADLIAPKLLNPLHDPAQVAETARVTIEAVDLATECPSLSPDLIPDLTQAMRNAFWDRITQLTKRL